MTVDSVEERACSVFRESIVIDATCPMLNRDAEWPKWFDGGVTAAMATVVINEDTAEAVAEIGRWYVRLRQNADRLLHATSTTDIERAKREGKLAVIFHFQNARALSYDPALVEVFHRLGLRAVQLTYNVKSPIGDGCSERTDCGLSDLGVAMIAEMNRVGVAVDLSHTGIQTTLDAMEVSNRPIVFSHSNARAVCDHPRNLTDEQILGAAKSGGVIGLNGYPAFVTRETNSPTIDDLLAHLDYMVELVGIDHVGLGIDYYTLDAAGYQDFLDTGAWKAEHYPPPPYHYPSGIDDASRLSGAAAGMARRGYSEGDISKVLGGNFLRVFKQIWGE